MSKPLPPRTIAAHSQAWNSAARIVIMGVCLLGLLTLAGIALFVHPEIVRDPVWACISLVAHLSGSGEFSRKHEK